MELRLHIEIRSGLAVITGVLEGEQRESDGVVLLTLKMEERVTNCGTGRPLEARKSQETLSPRAFRKGTQHCLHTWI